jgi:hypothetical protein
LSKRPHDIDVEVHLAVRHAHFVVSLYLGPHNGYHKSERINDLEEARKGGRILERWHASNRKAIVYAITPDGQSVMVPPTYDPAAMEAAIMNAHTKPSLSDLASAIVNPQSSVMKAAKTSDVSTISMSEMRGDDLRAPSSTSKAALRAAAADAVASHPVKKIAQGVTSANADKAAAASATPSKDAGKASTEIDLTLPAALDQRGKTKAQKQAEDAEALAKMPARPAKTETPAAKSDRITKAELEAQVSATKTTAKKPEKTKTARVESPDALKPIVPMGGAALVAWNEAEAKALKGTLPPVPDFSAETHAAYRDRLKDVVAMVKAGDIAGLKKNDVRPLWNSRTQIVRYREMALIALHAKAGKTYKVPGDHRNGAAPQAEPKTSKGKPAPAAAKKSAKAPKAAKRAKTAKKK